MILDKCSREYHQMKNLFIWNIAPDISDSDIRRVKLLNISCLVAMCINFIDAIILFSSDAPVLLYLVNFLSVIYFTIPLILSIQRKYILSQIAFVFSAPINFFLLYLIYAQDIGIQLYMFTMAILAIFIFKQKKLIYLALLWINLFYFLITISLKHHWFLPLSVTATAWIDFFWWNNLFGTITTTIILASVFRLETFNFENRLTQQNTLLNEQREEIQQSFEELQSTQEFLEQKQKEVIQKNIRIEKLYEDISSSIDYAQNIQLATLPTSKKMAHLLPDNFVFFKPRDVVSGDFYYLEEINEKIVLAAIDCTGHGVPGAFMSLIGNDLLNDIIKNRGITQPDQILTYLHLGVQQLLRQDETENQDGMDVALAVIDKKNQILEFAGAKNPLVYIQSSELKIIKGDKVSIGGEQRAQTQGFRTHQIGLNTSTVFYLFSDGIQDQFGGENNKKFTPARLRNLLLEIHQKPMDEQENIVSQTLSDWQTQGQEEQIDDMLLIGVKV